MAADERSLFRAAEMPVFFLAAGAGTGGGSGGGGGGSGGGGGDDVSGHGGLGR